MTDDVIYISTCPLTLLRMATRLYAPYRAVGYVCDGTPSAIQTRSSTSFLATSVGNAFHVYNVCTVWYCMPISICDTHFCLINWMAASLPMLMAVVSNAYPIFAAKIVLIYLRCCTVMHRLPFLSHCTPQLDKIKLVFVGELPCSLLLVIEF